MPLNSVIFQLGTRSRGERELSSRGITWTCWSQSSRELGEGYYSFFVKFRMVSVMQESGYFHARDCGAENKPITLQGKGKKHI